MTFKTKVLYFFPVTTAVPSSPPCPQLYSSFLSHIPFGSHLPLLLPHLRLLSSVSFLRALKAGDMASWVKWFATKNSTPGGVQDRTNFQKLSSDLYIPTLSFLSLPTFLPLSHSPIIIIYLKNNNPLEKSKLLSTVIRHKIFSFLVKVTLFWLTFALKSCFSF